jgi:folate-binding protein YgfZ
MMNQVAIDLSGRAKVRVIGADRFRFLNGQITNDLRKATEDTAIEACVLSAKGKMNAHIFVSVDGESFLLDAEPELRETLGPRLERYVIADDVQVEDVTDRFALFHVLSQQSPPREYGRVVAAWRFIEPGWDIWSDAARRETPRKLSELSSHFVFVDSAAAEALRIEQGLPRWGCELSEEIIPVEANLEERTIDYQKGCYIGQEVISRMKMSGQTNKRLCGLISLDDVALAPGMKLRAPEAGKEVGWLTSATHSQRMGKEIALGYVKRGFNNAGTRLNAFDPASVTPRPIPVEVAALPFR